MLEEYINLWSNWIPSEEILYIVLAVLFAKFLLNKIRKNNRFVNFAEQFDGPYAFPIIGNGFDFLYNMDGRMDILKLFEENYGPIYRLWFGKHLVISVADLKYLETVFSSAKMLNKPAFMDPAREFWGNNLFLSHAFAWRKSRKELQPLFVKNEMIRKVHIMNRIIHKYCQQIENHVNGPEFDIGKIFPLLFFDLLLEVVFNVSHLEYSIEDFISLDEVMHKADSIFLEKMFKPWLQNSMIDTVLYSRFKNRFKLRTTNFFEKIMGARIDGHNSGKLLERNLSYVQSLHRIRDELEIGDQYVQEETVNFIAAGTMTTSTTLSFCILMLAMHPKIQNKLYKEISENFQDENIDANADDLDRLPYLSQVLKETQRRFTIVPVMFRHVGENVNIGPYTFPVGSAILVPVCTIHMNPAYYENPEKFDPNHFNLDAVNERPKLAFLPFSMGARNCIGKSMAELELKLTLIALIRYFKFTTSVKMEDINLISGFSTASRKGYKVQVQRRA